MRRVVPVDEWRNHDGQLSFRTQPLLSLEDGQVYLAVRSVVWNSIDFCAITIVEYFLGFKGAVGIIVKYRGAAGMDEYR